MLQYNQEKPAPQISELEFLLNMLAEICFITTNQEATCPRPIS